MPLTFSMVNASSCMAASGIFVEQLCEATFHFVRAGAFGSTEIQKFREGYLILVINTCGRRWIVAS